MTCSSQLLDSSKKNAKNKKSPSSLIHFDITRVSDTVSTLDLYKLFENIGCSPPILRMTTLFHEDIKPPLNSTCDGFKIKNEVKQGYVLAPTFSRKSFMLSETVHSKTSVVKVNYKFVQ